MDNSIEKLFNDFSLFEKRLNTFSAPTDNDKIIKCCDDIVDYLYDHSLSSINYKHQKSEWEKFELDTHRNYHSKSLNELLTYLSIYNREEYWSGGYSHGVCYLRAFNNGTMQDIIRGIVNKLEEKLYLDNSINNGHVGIAGEYFVMAELTRRGFVASITSKNTKSLDILISDQNGNNLKSLQIKTSNNPNQKTWKMSKSVEENYSKSLFYVFVNLNDGMKPLYYIVPSDYVTYRVKSDYDEWLNTPGKNGNKHNETSMRTFKFINEIEEEQFKDAWYLL